MLWSLYNVVVVGVAAAVRIESPRAELAPSLIPELVTILFGSRAVPAWIIRLTTEDAWLRGGPLMSPGALMSIELDAVGRVPGVVTPWITAAVRSACNRPRRRADILSKLHTRAGNVGTQRTNFAAVLAGAFRRLLGV